MALVLDVQINDLVAGRIRNSKHATALILIVSSGCLSNFVINSTPLFSMMNWWNRSSDWERINVVDTDTTSTFF